MKKAKAEYVFFTVLFIALMGVFVFTSLAILVKLDMAIYYCSGQEGVGIPIGRMNGLYHYNDYHSWTKAIYDGEAILRDYLIECDGDIIIKITPTKDFIYVGPDWEHPYPEIKNRWCFS